MGVIEKLVVWLGKILLTYLADRAKKKALAEAERMRIEKERGEINAENLARYEAAENRSEDIRAALNLLNGTRAPQ